MSGAKPWKIFCRAPPLFGFTTTIGRFVSAFVMASTVWWVFCSLFFYSRCPRAHPFVKVGVRAPGAP